MQNIKPLIGISANYKENNSMLAEKYYESVIAAGGVPVIIPVMQNPIVIDKIVQQIDGLIVSGGGDIDAKYFNEAPIPESGEVNHFRDKYDVTLITAATGRQVPIFGICRGMQVINVVFGGSLYQDIKAQYDGFSLNPSQTEERNITTQTAMIRDNTILATVTGTDNLAINSFHHQSVRRVANGFQEVAFTSDGICEAIESEFYDIFGVQWHPEYLAAESQAHKNLFEHLVYLAKIFNRAKNIHKKHYSVDSHCDTPMFFDYKIDIGMDNDLFTVNPKDLGANDENHDVLYKAKVDEPKMRQGLLDAAFMVAYLPQRELDEQTVKATAEKTESILQKIIFQTNQHSDTLKIAKNFDDLKRAKQEDKKAIFLGIENGYGLGNDLKNIEKFYNLGVRYITLCHNGDNLICDSASKTAHTNNGLSEFGKNVINEMNRLGIMIDISHTGEKTFWDVINLSTKPIIASHSCVRTLCDHPRNLTDEQLKALAANGGVCQICLYKSFLTALPVASVDTAIEHINYIVQLVGVDYVGIGSDFDGGGEILGCTAANEFVNITKALIKNGYNDEEIGKIFGGNFLRVLSENQG
jgi:microsomal dipeptidase-like Zn-dependent dipeptidase/gamma-glutamyl-gamma-aminobutyrate hydrolase PuuD